MSNDDEADLLHVFDLPQLHTRPSAQNLLNVLELMTLDPPTWNRDDQHSSTNLENEASRNQGQTRSPRIDPIGLAGYLTRIVSSDLRWISDDGEKERIWEQASQRLSERSGRTARSALTRDFYIKTTDSTPSANANSNDTTSVSQQRTNYSHASSVCISIHEPALTADNLGLKTWAASYLLANRLWQLKHLLPSVGPPPQEAILELGAGTGLVGLAAAAVLGVGVVLTDLPEIKDNLARNINMNQGTMSRHGGSARAAILDWSDPHGPSTSSETGSCQPGAWNPSNGTKFPLILAADPLYSSEHPRLLVQAIQAWLLESPDARVIVELPLREAYATEVAEFQTRMRSEGLQVVCEGEEVGFDDWGDGQEEVHCWWAVWAWS